MRAPTRTHLDHRLRVTVFLGFLTSEDCRTACRQHARPEYIAAALTRLWFEDVYTPSTTGVDGVLLTPDPDDIARFEECFSADEQAVLERFHGFFELRLSFLTNQALGRAFFPENDSWRGLLQHARYVLKELDPDPDRLQAILAVLIRDLKQGTLMEGLTSPGSLSHRP